MVRGLWKNSVLNFCFLMNKVKGPSIVKYEAAIGSYKVSSVFLLYRISDSSYHSHQNLIHSNARK